MEILDLDFGILTDGKVWKLFHKDLSKGVDSRRSYTFDLGALKELASSIDIYGNEEIFRKTAKYFYYFFRKESFVQVGNTTPFVYDVFNKCKTYALTIEEDLRKRFMITMGFTCNALKKSCEDLNEEIDLEIIRNVAESHLFNILFVRSCEVRQILPIKSNEYKKRSLYQVIESLDAMTFDPQKNWDDYFNRFQFGDTFGGNKFTFESFQIFDRFIDLYEIIHNGVAQSKNFGFEIEGFKESIFSKDEWKFAKKHKINNRDMINILFKMSFIESKVVGRSHQQIPYSYFTPRQLGSIYESFLEYRLEKAESGMIFQKGQWQKANTNSAQVRKLKLVENDIVEKGNLFFSPNNEDRKMTGSYYTPDYIVKYIVESTMIPLVKNKTSNEILELKICDPAMGSGHFLAGCLDFLVAEYRKKWCEENNDDIDESIETTSRKILDRCIFGVDLNPRAVKLANMSLWLITAYAGKKLERLDDQLKCGDSLLGVDKNPTSKKFNWNKEFKHIFDKGGFDVFIGNPPYLGEKGHQKIFEQIKNSNGYEEMYDRRTNTYYYFIKLAHDLLNHGGAFGYIVPSEWKDNVSAKKLRSFIDKNCFEVVTIDFHDLKVFKNNGKSVGTSSLICVYSKCPTESKPYRFDLEGKEIQQKIDDNQLTLAPLLPFNKALNVCMKLFEMSNNIKLGIVKNKISHVTSSMTNVIKLGEHFHIDQGIVTGADLVTKKNKYISENWKEYEAKKNSGILILKVNQDIKIKGKEFYLNLGTLTSPDWKKLNSKEIETVKPLFKNKDLSSDGGYGNSSSYVIYFVDQQVSLDLDSLPVIKEHLEKYKKVLTSSKTNCYHNTMLKNIMKPIIDRGNYFVVFYSRPKTDFEGEKIVFVCDQEGQTFVYNNGSFYGSGGNKGGLSFISKKESCVVSLKYAYAYFLSDLYKSVNANKPSSQFLSSDAVKELKIPVELDTVNTNLYKLVVGDYHTEKKIGYIYHPSTSTYIKEKGLVDLYIELVQENKEIKVCDIIEPSLKKRFSSLKILTKEKLRSEINLVLCAICEVGLKKSA
jgi:hypothetical protein